MTFIGSPIMTCDLKIQYISGLHVRKIILDGGSLFKKGVDIVTLDYKPNCDIWQLVRLFREVCQFLTQLLQHVLIPTFIPFTIKVNSRVIGETSSEQ